jgi:ParB family chromosome partitioning protein
MRQALGKGIDALIARVENNEAKNGVLQKISLEKIEPNPEQPRKVFHESSLAELAQSIARHGLTQPIVVRRDAKRETYILVAGERRWRASKLAGLGEIDAIVHKDLDRQSELTKSLIENIQREDLNPIDMALAYRKLMDEFGITQGELAQYCGKSRSSVANTLRLLDLDDDIQKMIQSGRIREGHARTLMSIGDRESRRRAYELMLTEDWSVRQAEDHARGLEGAVRRPRRESAAHHKTKSPEVIEMEKQLEGRLGSKVEIYHGPSGENGKIILHYYSLEDFDRITQIIKQ